jgi:hypothetical protein
MISLLLLKGHGNEPVFPMFLHKSLWPRSLTLPFKPFRFWLRIIGDKNRKVDKISWSIHFFKPLITSSVIVNHIPGLFFAK